MNREVRAYLAAIGRRGGQKSRRELAPHAAREMVRVREARRAFRKFHALCFWSFAPDYKVSAGEVEWVAEQLMKHGDRSAWETASRLCR